MSYFIRASDGAFYRGDMLDGDRPATTQEEDTYLLNASKTSERAEVISGRNATITGGFLYMGKTIDSDRDSVAAITGAGVAALAAKASSIPYSVTWTCADDSTLSLDADGVLGMVVTLALFADAQHTKARPLKDAIKNATTVADVKKVKW